MSDIGWGIIGVPNGFQHISEGITANSTISSVDNRLCIEDYEKESLYAVIYDTAIVEGTNNRQLMVYFVQYNFSKETGKDRSGSFYGSYIALPGRVPVNLDCCKDIIDILNKLSDHNKSIYIENNKFVRDYTSIFEFPSLEKELEKFIKNTDKAKLPTKKIDNKKDIVVYANDPSEVFLNSIELYDVYSRIYISSNEGYCRYIDEVSNTNYKELLDLKKESLDIIEARRIEQDRIERYNREIEEERVRKQKKEKEEKRVEAELYEKEAKKTFKNLEKTFFYCTKGSELDELVDKSKTGVHDDIELLKDISKSLEEHIKNSNDIAKFIENRKNNLDKEIVELEGATHPISNELILAAQAVSIESHSIPQPVTSPFENNRNNQSARKNQSARNNKNIRNNQNFNNLQHDSNIRDYAIYIWIVVIILILLVIGFGVKTMFFSESSDSTKYQKVITTSENVINDMDGSIQDAEGYPIDTLSNDTVIPKSLLDCNYNQRDIKDYTVSTDDIRDIGAFDSLRSDSDIVSQITESILLQENTSDISSEVKYKFKQMLMECNESLNLEKHNSIDPNSNLLPIKPNDLIHYVSIAYLK